MKKSIPTFREQESEAIIPGNTRERELEWKKTFPKLGNGKGMKKSIPTFREQESGAINPGNTQEREREWQEKTK